MIDTHLHLIDRSRLAYPWLAGVPALDRDATYADYAQTAQRLGIVAALHMEVDVAPDQIGAETAWIAELMAAPDSLIVGAIAAARPESSGFAAYLDGLDRRVVKGLRRVLHVVPDEMSQTAVFRDNIRRMGQAGLPFDLCVLARQLPIALDLVRACPDTVFVLDHCGVPDIAAGAFEPWARDVAALAQHPNVMAKLSGLPTYAAADWTYADLRPYADHLISCFGADRLVWGSDSPVCSLNSNMDQWVAVSRGLLGDLTAPERFAILQGNACRIWGLETP